MTKAQAKELYEYYDKIVKSMMEAKLKLLSGGVKSYTLGNSTLTMFDIDNLSKDIDDAVRKRDEYAAIMNGKSSMRAVGVVPRDW